MDRTTKVLLSLILVVNLAAAGALGYTAYRANEMLDSLRATQTVLTDSAATAKEVNQAVRDALKRVQDTQNTLQNSMKRFNPLAR